MNFKEFIKEEGLKKLALTNLKSSSFSIVIYLFNEILAGVEEIISSRKELSLMLGWNEKQLCEGLDELQFCNIIHITEVAGKPLRIRANLNFESWNEVQTQGDFHSKKNFMADKNSHKNNVKLIDLNVFEDPIPFPKKSEDNFTQQSALDNNSQQNFSTLNDLNAFRERHENIDTKIKDLALTELDLIKHEKRPVTPDEELLLQILSQHHQPRKQLLLALRSNLIYPNLKFFLAAARVCAEIPDVNKK